MEKEKRTPSETMGRGYVVEVEGWKRKRELRP